MKSSIRILRNKSVAPIPLDGGAGRYARGVSFSLGAGKGDRETFMRQYGLSGTVYSIVSLLAETAATPTWHLYKKQPQDGRVRYTTSDQGSDQRIEVVQHPAIQLWNNPNDFHSAFEFREGSQQHEELTGETFWVLDNEAGFPTSMWYVRPDRMEPIPDPNDYLVGWIYTGPNGEQIPLRTNEVVMQKRPDPLDSYRGSGPVASIMPNIQQQRYATEYQRNLFLNGADPGGVITVPNKLTDRDFDQLIDRWRESHRGVARAGQVGVLEDGMAWAPNAHTNKDMEYGQLRLANRDELREAWRVHKTMMGTSDDVNRANAQTAQEVFVTWQVIPRLNRRRDTLNSKFLPLFGSSGAGVEFDYEDPSPVNAEAASNEMLQKTQAWAALVGAGADPHDAAEVVGLPDMDIVEKATQQPALPPGWVAAPPAAPEPSTPGAGAAQTDDAQPQDRERIEIRNAKDPAAKVIKQESVDYPASAIAWMYHASWIGPTTIPADHVDFDSTQMDGADPDHVQDFVKKLREGKKVNPVILVKIPGQNKLQLADGHHRFLAYEELDTPVRAFVGTITDGSTDWQDMHTAQYRTDGRGEATKDMAALLRRVLTDGYVPVETGVSYARR